MEQCFNRPFSSLRPQPHSRAPRALRKARGLASDPKAPVVQVQRTHRSIAFGKRVGSRATPLLSAREASPRTILFDRAENMFFQHLARLSRSKTMGLPFSAGRRVYLRSRSF